MEWLQSAGTAHCQLCRCNNICTMLDCRRTAEYQPARVLRSLGDVGCLGDLGDPTLAGTGPRVDFSTGLKLGLELVLGPCWSSCPSSAPSDGAVDSTCLLRAGGCGDAGEWAGLLGELGLSAWSGPASASGTDQCWEMLQQTDCLTCLRQIGLPLAY